MSDIRLCYLHLNSLSINLLYSFSWQSLERHLMSPPEMPGQPLAKNILQVLHGGEVLQSMASG